MIATRLTAWLRPALTLLAATGVLALTACGGGSGAPNNPFEPGPAVPTPLVVVPDEATAYAGTPLILAISGGTPPYEAFSANPAALPVPQSVSGDTLALLANNVDAPQSANITIRDALNQVAVSEITVRPAVLLPASITIVPNSAPCPGGDACSGQTSVATVKATGAGGTALSGRQVRFDVVQGTFSLATTNPGAPLASTQTVVTDVNGEARVIISVPAATPTQIGLLRATELQSGSQVTGQFVIAQVTSGEGVLSVAPSGSVQINGSLQNVCSSGVRVSFYIFGGTPPYRVVTNFPGAVTLVGTPVTTNGGGFQIVTNGSCFINLTFAITDATGRTLTSGLPTVTNSPGSAVPPTPPQGLQVLASGTGGPGLGVNCTGATFPMTITGIPPFSAAASSASVVLNPNPLTTSPGTLNVSNVPGNAVADPLNPVATAITVGDASTPQQLRTVTIYCQ